MKGYLRVFVLKVLEGKAHTGSELMVAIGEAFGKKPSPGTIYPLLADLVEQGLISVRTQSNKKQYQLTTHGRSLLAKLVMEKQKALGKVVDVMQEVIGASDADKMRASMQTMSTFDADFHLRLQLKDAIADFLNSKHASKHRDEYRDLLQNTIARLRRISK